MEQLLNHPHSRFIASTNYMQYYTQQYENEIVSKKKEFNNFFSRYREVTEDSIAFNNLEKMLTKGKNLKNLSILKTLSESNILNECQLNEGIEKLIQLREINGRTSETNNYLKHSLEACNKYSNDLKDKIAKFNKGKQKRNDIDNDDSDISELEEQMKRLLERGDNLIAKAIKVEHDYQQEMLKYADEQALKSKITQNSDLIHFFQ